ncbi:uncharacterized protein [Pleurodeles waltl]|uniref:uncharacterized protein n=1 Tax=Pleurodeles waltl TaxID=8319 RepID=UPI003709964B
MLDRECRKESIVASLRALGAPVGRPRMRRKETGRGKTPRVRTLQKAPSRLCGSDGPPSLRVQPSMTKPIGLLPPLPNDHPGVGPQRRESVQGGLVLTPAPKEEEPSALSYKIQVLLRFQKVARCVSLLCFLYKNHHLLANPDYTVERVRRREPEQQCPFETEEDILFDITKFKVQKQSKVCTIITSRVSAKCIRSAKQCNNLHEKEHGCSTLITTANMATRVQAPVHSSDLFNQEKPLDATDGDESSYSTALNLAKIAVEVYNPVAKPSHQIVTKGIKNKEQANSVMKPQTYSLFAPLGLKELPKEIRLTHRVIRILKSRPQERNDQDIRQVLAALHHVAAFRSYSTKLQRNVARVAWYSRFESRQVVIQQGQRPHSFYICLSGSASVIKRHRESGQVKPAWFFTQGDTFGDSDILSDERWQFTVIIQEPAEFLCIDREETSTCRSAVSRSRRGMLSNLTQAYFHWLPFCSYH